jgi:beta-lactamase superfamily II metal-dependent hydrolase
MDTTNSSFRIKIRMYRQGLGDCFLITLPKKGQGNFYVMIDCCVVTATEKPEEKMKDVLQDIAKVTDKQIDLLIVTHEHWDHLSGILQAEEEFKSLKFKDVWLGWTEDDKDPLAQKLKGERIKLCAALQAAESTLRMAGAARPADEVASVIELFGAAGSKTTSEALNRVKTLETKVRYCRPTDSPVRPEGLDANFYILGPPLDEQFIKKSNPSKSSPETYGIDATECYLNGAGPALTDPDPVAPFDTIYQIPEAAARQMPFFHSNYWADSKQSQGVDQSWRRIDTAWLESSTTMALMLDSATNNTSLVLAIELDGGDVLLFAGDAQVGNWLSWQGLKWENSGVKVSGPDLLRRTMFYKVGHHGSHNATLCEKGLEMMESLQVAMVPVDHEMAVKKRWGKMPLPSLITRLNEKTTQRVVRIDEEVPASLKSQADSTKLYHEITF